jgi:hydroxymethylbilane synthase
MTRKIVIATRGSKLALWQAEYIRNALNRHHSGLEAELSVIKTSGDKIQDAPLYRFGGKGLFVKEIEEALLDGRADLAVHSMKDIPSQLPGGLTLGIVPERADSRDCFLSTRFADLADLPRGGTVGTSSLRRQAQVLALRPDLRVESLRGNLDTRIRKLEEGRYDAIVAAAAGLQRLQLAAVHTAPLDPERFLPAVGQGALGLEYRAGDRELADLLAFMDHPESSCRLAAERSLLHRLEGGCQVPIGGHARMLDSGTVYLCAFVADVRGDPFIRREGTAVAYRAGELGRDIADQILAAGGADILRRVYQEGELP